MAENKAKKGATAPKVEDKAPKMYSRKLTQRNKRNLIRHLLLHLQKEQQAINQL